MNPIQHINLLQVYSAVLLFDPLKSTVDPEDHFEVITA
jgi:hypothetical protein